MFANNTEEVIESDDYGEAVFDAVDDNMDEQDFSRKELKVPLINVHFWSRLKPSGF